MRLKLSEWASVAEIIGAAAVIISLVYDALLEAKKRFLPQRLHGIYRWSSGARGDRDA